MRQKHTEKAGHEDEAFELGERCMNCRGKVKVNFQKLWVEWSYDPETPDGPTERGILDGEPDEGENLFYCEECAILWKEGKI